MSLNVADVENFVEVVPSQEKEEKSDEIKDIIKEPTSEMTTTASSVTEETKTPEQQKEELKELFTQGKRDYIAGQFDSASDKLSKASSLAVSIYGQFAVEAFEPFIYYGKTLIELCSMEDDVIQNAMQGITDTAPDSDDETEDITEEERAEIREKVEEAMEEKPAGTVVADEENDVPADETKETTESENTESDAPAETKEEINEDADAMDEDESEKDEDASVEEDGGKNEEEGGVDGDGDETMNDGPTTIQNCWEILEVARKICELQPQCDEWDLKKSEVLSLLGDCSIEDENYSTALEDLSLCLEIQKRLLKSTDRKIAQTFFTLARAHKLSNDFVKAAECYSSAKNVILSKIAELETAPEEEQSQLAELKSLLPDIQLKIEDAQESSIQQEKMKNEIKETFHGVMKAVAETCGETPEANDISHMVRKSGKRSAVKEDDETATKRVKSDEVDEEKVASTTEEEAVKDSQNEEGMETADSAEKAEEIPAVAEENISKETIAPGETSASGEVETSDEGTKTTEA